ncbi:penicillin-binding transpeptidase domain-containing protein [Streptomyces coeruleorubidus]|uniref:Penicillin-binding transpeptidase domain-containing protein n=1 Tax=Streptomyces coeruleorubidus TaxID=116188 RepID=A0ABZ0KE76_STRC4|nr:MULTISPECIES: penicillin-binding transpeptidase domain-containing protein [Streptomyces]WOT36083.1 penicillin-binding transpeptidase domain-containing protein [Streptomyces coeruleorubidus]GGT82299.1 penicillin-binding protein [Streptomyces bellus]
MDHHDYTSVTTGGRRPRRTALRAVTAGAVVLAVAAGGAFAAGLGPFERDTGPDPAAGKQARAFLADWAAGRLPSAAGRTTSPGTAQRVLDSFTTGLDISKPKLTAESAAEGEDGTVTVPFTARMPVEGLGTWTYESKLPLREQSDGSWKVDWKLSLVHPRLSDTEKFRLEREETKPPEVTDREGTALSGAEFPSLGPVMARLGGGGEGTGPRGAIHLVDRTTGKVERTEATFGARTVRDAGPVRTTLDADWQAAAEKALAAHADGKNAALVALRIDDGEILAVANSPSSGFNRALSGTYAPGSTWKVVTSSALLLKDAVTPDDVVDCPKYLTVGKRFQNVELSEHPGATFHKDFTESCNTAFISLRDRLGDGDLGDVARKYFGVGQEWHVGAPSYDGSVPVPKDETEKAASMIGQGRVQANPLIMASVTATAVSGTFHQPSLTEGNEDTTSTTPLPEGVVAQLREMLRATVTDGTARVLSDLPGEIGAKTGTAEVSDDQDNNGWLVAHRGNVAVACVVEEGVTGGGSAGPVVRGLLAAVPGDSE